MCIDKTFVLAGDATFTLELPATYAETHQLKPHYTFNVNMKEADGKFPDTWFVKLLTGPDNKSDYSYVGMVEPFNGNVRLTRASKLTADSLVYKLLLRTLSRVWKDEQSALAEHGFKLHHEGRCGRCGKPLTTPLSVERGIGPDCWEKMNGE